jgi:hypothetical protein
LGKDQKQSALNSVSSIIQLSQLSQWNSIFHPLSNFFHFVTDLTPKLVNHISFIEKKIPTKIQLKSRPQSVSSKASKSEHNEEEPWQGFQRS